MTSAHGENGNKKGRPRDEQVMATDSELLRESRRRPDAFVEVCERHASSLRTWLRHEAGDATDDLLAETFARAWLARRRFRDPGDGSAGAWLHGIARNLVRDGRRRGAIETRARRRLGLPLGSELSAFGEAEDRVDASSDFAVLAPLVAELSDDQRNALELRVVEELDYAEIAERLEISPVTARTRVHRALKSLRRQTETSER